MSAVQGIRKRGRSSGFNRSFRFGFPIVAGCIIGYAGIAHIIQGRAEVDKEKEQRDWELLAVTRALTQEGPLKDLKLKKPSTLEEELKAIQKKVDIDSFEYKSVPRPAEKPDN